MPASQSTARAVALRRARVQELWAQGTKTSAIAHELDVHGALVRQDVRRLRKAGYLLAPRQTARRQAEQDRQLIERYRQGAPLQQLGQELGYSAVGAAKRLHDLRARGTPLPHRVPRWTHAEHARLIDLYLAGASRTELAEELGRTPQAIKSQIKRLRRGGHELYRGPQR